MNDETRSQLVLLLAIASLAVAFVSLAIAAYVSLFAGI